MRVDMQIAFGLNAHINKRMLGKLIQHVIEKADAGLDIAAPRAVEIDRYGNLGFLGLAVHRGGALVAFIAGHGLFSHSFMDYSCNRELS